MAVFEWNETLQTMDSFVRDFSYCYAIRRALSNFAYQVRGLAVESQSTVAIW
jgi:hypothetical protein